jgi:carbon-monoxide dehydrogenase small subunit
LRRPRAPEQSFERPQRSGATFLATASRTAQQETGVDIPISLTVNGKSVTKTVDSRTLLVQYLREQLQLTGTHVGCDTAQCGACTVHMNGRAIKSCSILAAQVQGSQITTIEGLAKNGELHPMQAAFRECHGLQCGFCTPGMVMSAVQLLADNPKASEDEIREALDGNICRCTGYHNIVKSIQFCQSGQTPTAV